VGREDGCKFPALSQTTEADTAGTIRRNASRYRKWKQQPVQNGVVGLKFYHLSLSLSASEAIQHLGEAVRAGEAWGVWQQRRSATHITEQPGMEIVQGTKINSFCSLSPSFR